MSRIDRIVCHTDTCPRGIGDGLSTLRVYRVGYPLAADLIAATGTCDMIGIAQSFSPVFRHRSAFVKLLLSAAIMASAAAESGPALGRCLIPPGDISGTSAKTDVVDVQCEILVTLWTLTGKQDPLPTCFARLIADADLDCDGLVSVTDTLLLVAASLGSPWNPVLDANKNLCADLCELDSDGDGVQNVDDCAPHNPSIFPKSQEVCNAYDDNCNGTVDTVGTTPVSQGCADTQYCNGVETCPPSPISTGIEIHELMVMPQAAPNGAGQWVELYNRSPSPIDINGWTLTLKGGPSHTIVHGQPLWVPAHGFVVLAGNTGVTQNGGLVAEYSLAPFVWTSDKGIVQLVDHNKKVKDSLAYGESVGLPVVPGQSLALISVGGPLILTESWGLSTHVLPSGDKGTPHGPNVDLMPGATCQPGAPPNCNDGNGCTVDGCIEPSGCVHVATSGSCGPASPCFGESTCRTKSAQSCAELAWSFVGGSPTVCGESDAAPLGGCSGDLHFLEAAQFCTAAGARLCTFSELLANEAVGTGCNYNSARVWTSTPCGPSAVYTTAGSAGFQGTVPTECTPMSSTGVVVRCCADGDPNALPSGCTLGTPVDCDDGDSCTKDSCDPVLGCKNDGECSNGCVESLVPGCQGCACESWVCNYDPYCCSTAWDRTCVMECGLDDGCIPTCGNDECEGGESCANCPGDCGSCQGGCCKEHAQTGCNQLECQSCVCSHMPECCVGSYTHECIEVAEGACSDVCDCAVPGGTGCCDPHFGVGCNATECQQAVCGLEVYCCSVAWDIACAAIAALFYSDVCPCEPPPDNNCCSGHPGRGCDMFACTICMSYIDPLCVTTLWDDPCAETAKVTCGATCGCDVDLPSGGAGCTTGSKGCGDCACKPCVCAFQPNCCTNSWDSVCVDLCKNGCGFDCP